jgi:hypothetical protein
VRGALALLPILTLALACAQPDLPPAQIEARQTVDDSDPLALVPGEAELLLSLDLGALRASPWSQPVIAAGANAPRRPRGYDEIRDVDRVLLVGLPADAAGPSLTIAQGRFDRARVRAAFAAGRKVMTAGFRGCTVWSADAEATTFLTDRTLLTGALGSVRAAIDVAYGKARDVRGQAWLTDVHRRFGKDPGPAAIELAVLVSDPMRRKLRDELAEAEGLVRLGARATLGRRLDVAVVGTTATPEQASALISEVGVALRDLQTRPSILALGLAPVLADVQLAVQGPRVAAELRLDARDRDEIARRLAAVAQLLSGRVDRQDAKKARDAKAEE